MEASGLADLADKGGNIFAAAQDAQRLAIKLGRQQMAGAIVDILCEEKNDGRAIARVLSLCKREVK